MGKKHTLFAVLALAISAAYAEFDYQVAPNGIGDWNLVTVGGLTFAKPAVINLAPTNAPSAEATYALRCQVIYQDNEIRRPQTAEELHEARLRGAVLVDWLKGYIKDEYAGAEFSELLEKYYSGALAADLNAKFPSYVASQIEAMPESSRVDIEEVTVTVEAEADFKAELMKLYAASEQK